MNLKDLADILNMDLCDTIERFGNNEMLFIKFLKKFSDDNTYNLLCESVETENYDDIEKNAHTLKGIAANLGFKILENDSNNIVLAVRNKDFDKIPVLFDNLKNSYNMVINNLLELE